MIAIAAHGSKGLPAWPTGRLRLTRSPTASPCRNAPLNRARLRLAVATSRISGLPESIVDHLLFDQDESRTGEALCGNIGVTLPMHRFMPIGDANSHALLKTSGCTAQTNTAQPRSQRGADLLLQVGCGYPPRFETIAHEYDMVTQPVSFVRPLSGPSPQGVHT
ncbi:MAG: hypothetical protein WA864_16410 [Acetobacteraceae bacterium]